MLLALIAAASLGSMPVEIDQQLWFRATRLPQTRKPYFGKVALTVNDAGSAPTAAAATPIVPFPTRR